MKLLFVTHKSIASDVCECGGAKARNKNKNTQNINVKTHPSGINDVIDVFRWEPHHQHLELYAVVHERLVTSIIHMYINNQNVCFFGGGSNEEVKQCQTNTKKNCNYTLWVQYGIIYIYMYNI